MIKALTENTLLLYIEADFECEEMLIRHAHTHPKPLFYNPAFIAPKLEDKPNGGQNIEPLDFARPLFPELLAFRKPRYTKIAERYGFTINAKDLFRTDDKSRGIPDADAFLMHVYNAVAEQACTSKIADSNLTSYLKACQKRAEERIT